MSTNVFVAVRARNRFISKHSELRVFQKYVDDLLDKSGASYNRLIILDRLIHDHDLQPKKQYLLLQRELECLKIRKNT